MREINVAGENANQRLDKFLMKYLNEAPKGFIYKMLRKKNIKLNGAKAEGGEILKANDVIALYLADETVDKFSSEKIIISNNISLNIVYEDSNVLVLNKPRGLLTHPDSAGDTDTLLNRALGYLHEKGEFDNSKTSVFTPAFCNRLDMNTTGVIVCGKNLNALQQLNKAVSGKNALKYYVAIVCGEIGESGRLEGFHTKNKMTNEVEISPEGSGKEAVTEFEPIMVKNNYTLLKIKLITGRSHQIRAHMASIGHPVLGDRKYGEARTNMPKFQMLHSESISFSGLSGELEYLCDKNFTAEKPLDFIKWEHKLFNSGGI